jgi:hypothetical protein
MKEVNSLNLSVAFNLIPLIPIKSAIAARTIPAIEPSSRTGTISLLTIRHLSM